MIVPPSEAWNLVLAIALGASILLSAYARAPRQAVPAAELRRLVLCALALYAIGGLASLTRHPVLAGLVYAAGIGTCALAAWLSRGVDSGGPPRGEEPVDEQPPPEPDGLPELDWASFERDFRRYTDQERTPAGRS